MQGVPEQALPAARRYGEYGLAQGLGLVALQNAAGAYVRPSEAFLANITDVFGSDLHFPNSTASAAWANTSVAGSTLRPPPTPPPDAD